MVSCSSAKLIDSKMESPLGSSAGARLYSIAVHVLALVGAGSLVALGLHLGAPNSSPPAVRHAPVQALAMVSMAPMAGPGPDASHANGSSLKGRASRIAAKPRRGPSVQSQPLLPGLGPDVDVVFNEPLGQAPAQGRVGTGRPATDEAAPQLRSEPAPSNGEDHERPRLAEVQTVIQPDRLSAEDNGVARPLLVLVDATQGPRADQPLLPNFSASAVALPDVDRSADDPPTGDSKDATAREDGAGEGSGNGGDLARPNLDAQDGVSR